jgi:hypothetical protein
MAERVQTSEFVHRVATATHTDDTLAVVRSNRIFQTENCDKTALPQM